MISNQWIVTIAVFFSAAVVIADAAETLVSPEQLELQTMAILRVTNLFWQLLHSCD